MDGDASAKYFDSGANSAIRNVEGSDAIHEASHQADPVGEKTRGTGTSAFNKDGAIGSMFKADGAIGGKADKVGGPFSKDGAVGKQFSVNGSIGGAVQNTLGKNEKI